FTTPASATFEQVFFSPRLRGDAASADAAAALQALREGAEPAGNGDPSPLGERLDDATRERVDVLFGEALTQAVFGTLEPGRWDGPYRSDFGLHLIRLVERQPARLPAFDEAREQIAAAYAADRRARANAEEYARMRARYDVVVEW